MFHNPDRINAGGAGAFTCTALAAFQVKQLLSIIRMYPGRASLRAPGCVRPDMPHPPNPRHVLTMFLVSHPKCDATSIIIVIGPHLIGRMYNQDFPHTSLPPSLTSNRYVQRTRLLPRTNRRQCRNPLSFSRSKAYNHQIHK